MHLFSEFGDGLRAHILPRDNHFHKTMEPGFRLMLIVIATMISVAMWVGLYALIRWII